MGKRIHLTRLRNGAEIILHEQLPDDKTATAVAVFVIEYGAMERTTGRLDDQTRLRRILLPSSIVWPGRLFS